MMTEKDIDENLINLITDSFNSGESAGERELVLLSLKIGQMVQNGRNKKNKREIAHISNTSDLRTDQDSKTTKSLTKRDELRS
jgi:hypothetical protein